MRYRHASMSRQISKVPINLPEKPNYAWIVDYLKIKQKIVCGKARSNCGFDLKIGLCENGLKKAWENQSNL